MFGALLFWALAGPAAASWSEEAPSLISDDIAHSRGCFTGGSLVIRPGKLCIVRAGAGAGSGAPDPLCEGRKAEVVTLQVGDKTHIRKNVPFAAPVPERTGPPAEAAPEASPPASDSYEICFRNLHNITAFPAFSLEINGQKVPLSPLVRCDETVYIMEQKGSGLTPWRGSEVYFTFSAWLLNGTEVFPSTKAIIRMGGDLPIKGWRLLDRMRPGEVAVGVFPPAEVYGGIGFGPVPANTAVAFRFTVGEVK